MRFGCEELSDGIGVINEDEGRSKCPQVGEGAQIFESRNALNDFASSRRAQEIGESSCAIPPASRHLSRNLEIVLPSLFTLWFCYYSRTHNGCFDARTWGIFEQRGLCTGGAKTHLDWVDQDSKYQSMSRAGQCKVGKEGHMLEVMSAIQQQDHFARYDRVVKAQTRSWLAVRTGRTFQHSARPRKDPNEHYRLSLQS